MDKIIFYVKFFGKEKYREEFLAGHLRMNTLGYFRRYEDSQAGNIGDPHEAPLCVLQPSLFTMSISDTTGKIDSFTIPQSEIIGPTFFQSVALDGLNLFCMYAVHDRGFTSKSDDDFERFIEEQMLRQEIDGLGGFAAIVIQAKVFQDRVLQALSRESPKYMAGLVNYYDPITFHGQFDEDRAAFNKRDTFAHQREYRFVLNRETDEEEIIQLDIGSIQDLCVPCETREVNGIIKDLLYQLRAQINPT